MLWFNGIIYTMEREGDRAEAVYTENGRVQAIGSKEKLEEQFSPIERYYDLEGATMFPGFTDSHLHMIALGETMLRLDLSECTSSEEMKQKLQERARTLKPGQWLIGEGWNENNFSDRKIFHRGELDEIAPDNPVFLTRICRHAALVNSPSLEKAGIDKRTPNPPGGIITRNDQGEATGYLLDQAADLVRETQPEVTDEELRQALQLAVREMLKKGLTGGHTEDLNYYGGFERTFRTFQHVIHEEGLKFRTNLLVHHEVVDDMKKLGFDYGRVDDYLSFGAMKIFADGAFGGRTALLRRPYNDAPETSGVAIHSVAELKELVNKAREEEMPVAVHTIGDLALEYTIEALETHPVPNGKKDRIIHAQVTPPDLIERLKQLPVVLDLQPRFVLSDFPWVEERLGKDRIHDSFAWKTLIDAGVDCAGSSDSPIEPVDPLTGIHAAITRKKAQDQHDGYLPEQKVTPFEAVSLYTTGSAKAIGKEKEFGKIAPGFRADFTILKDDILNIDGDEILNTCVVGTVIDGEFQYQNTSKK